MECMFVGRFNPLSECPLSKISHVSNNFSTTVHPEITEHPEDKVAIENDTVSFTCSARSLTDPVIIDWLLNGTLTLKDQPRFNITTPPDQVEAGIIISGSTLTINNVTGFDSSLVRCRIANNSGILSQGANLDVLGEQEKRES